MVRRGLRAEPIRVRGVVLKLFLRPSLAIAGWERMLKYPIDGCEMDARVSANLTPAYALLQDAVAYRQPLDQISVHGSAPMQ